MKALAKDLSKNSSSFAKASSKSSKVKTKGETTKKAKLKTAPAIARTEPAQKQKMIRAFISQLEVDLENMKAAALAAHEAATHEESQPENEYDTRGLEASYLAGAQAKRAAEINEVITLFKSMPFKDFAEDDSVQTTALVDLRMSGKQNQILVMPKGGGVRIDFEGHAIQIVTPQSSLGQAIIGLKAGEVAEFEVGENVRECEVLAVV